MVEYGLYGEVLGESGYYYGAGGSAAVFVPTSGGGSNLNQLFSSPEMQGGGGGGTSLALSGGLLAPPPDPAILGIPGLGHVPATIDQLVGVVKPLVPQIIALAGQSKWAAIAALLVGALGSLPWTTILAVVAALVGLGLLAKWIYDKIKARGRKRRKRYSIGSNPRMGTLLKVGKKVDNIFLRYDKRVRKFRSRIRGYNPRPAFRPHYARGR